ncbi:MAG TPA: PKD domain-containing protein [Oscillatoriaceae cyanobacterium]
MRRLFLLAALCAPLLLAGCDLPTTIGLNPDGSINVGGSGSGTGIQITAENIDPSEKTVPEGAQVQLSVSTDPQATSYQWSASGGDLSSTSDASVVWTAPHAPGNYHVDVTVSDGSSQNSAEMLFTVP